mmetsp:Transcript_22498/g.53093  ORF Transcript_22498/g.53093 Transcript_22498/m.53093 type:complete len:461 (-) Transcript_22498:445-1827(-)
MSISTEEQNGTSSCPNSNWTKEQLTGKSVTFDQGLPEATASKLAVSSPGAQKRQSIAKAPKDSGIDPALWGRPGHLTDAEADTYLKFKEVVDLRGGDFQDTVFCFGKQEGEVYALTRWLRARKYVFEDVMIMVEEATKCQAAAKKAGYYADPAQALGCPEAVYNRQYPQVYSGIAKNGMPVFFSKIGVLNIDAVECITTISNIVKYHWYVQMHDFTNRLREHKKKNPDFNSVECVCILDLANLTMGQLNSKTMAIVKEQSAIDSLCFPETLNKMYIVNSPRFFSATWNIIKGWIDARTANKVEVISSRKAWEKSLLDYIDADQLPSDYGGNGPLTQATMEKEGFTGKVKGLHTEVLYLRTSASATFDILAGEELDVVVYTRSNIGATFTISDAKNKAGQVLASNVHIKHHGEDLDKLPSNVTLTKQTIKGPASVEVKAKSLGSRFAGSTNYLVVFSVLNP